MIKKRYKPDNLQKTKRCRKCKHVKPVRCFDKDPTNKDGYDYRCKLCKGAFFKYSVKKESKMVKGARIRASKNNYPCTITADDITIPDVCPLLGIPLIWSKGKTTENTPSLDKIIPEKGYIPGNIWVISNKANRMKSDITKEFAIKLIEVFEKAEKEIENQPKKRTVFNLIEE